LFGDINRIKSHIISSIKNLDLVDEDIGLDDEDRYDRRGLLSKLNQINFKQKFLLKQKARVKWLEAGDLNTRYFHTMLKWRRLKNIVHGIHIQEQWCEESSRVKMSLEIILCLGFLPISRPGLD